MSTTPYGDGLFDSAFGFTVSDEIEGGLTDDPNDPGGITNLGLTVMDLTVWERHQATPDDVRALTKPLARPIYRAMYWRTVNGDRLPGGISLSVFDHGVNRGVGTSAKILQRLIGLTDHDVDGDIGPKTLRVLDVHLLVVDLGRFLDDLHEAQRADYAMLQNPHFEHGWERRCDLRDAAARTAAGLARS